jgi:hypothetical protein
MNIQTKNISPSFGEERVQALDWERISQDLDAQGNAVLDQLIPADACRQLAALYPQVEPFRSHIVMARHGFGRGEYKYFAYPLPGLTANLRTALYSYLAPIANRWNVSMGIDVSYPEKHEEFLTRCHAAGQLKPTPLLLQYSAGDYNCLHQIFMASMCSPFRLRYCCPNLLRTLQEANSY